MPTLEDLDNLVQKAVALAEDLRHELYPNGKPDYMTQEDWDNINEF